MCVNIFIYIYVCYNMCKSVFVCVCVYRVCVLHVHKSKRIGVQQISTIQFVEALVTEAPALRDLAR